MSEQEKTLLMALDEKFTQLPETEQNYVMGVTHGLLMARETAQRNDKKGAADDECA